MTIDLTFAFAEDLFEESKSLRGRSRTAGRSPSRSPATASWGKVLAKLSHVLSSGDATVFDKDFDAKHVWHLNRPLTVEDVVLASDVVSVRTSRLASLFSRTLSKITSSA